MFRRYSLLVGSLILTATLGCGLVQRDLPTTQSLRPGTVTRTFDQPLMLLLDAAVGADRDAFRFDEIGFDFDLPTRTVGSATFIPIKPTKEPLLIDAASIPIEHHHLIGKTRDGRRLTVWFQARENRSKTEVTVLIGRHGDPELSNVYLDQLAARLAHPTGRTPQEIAERKVRFYFDFEGLINTPAGHPEAKPRAEE